jgi:hypothetical protein
MTKGASRGYVATAFLKRTRNLKQIAAIIMEVVTNPYSCRTPAIDANACASIGSFPKAPGSLKEREVMMLSIDFSTASAKLERFCKTVMYS